VLAEVGEDVDDGVSHVGWVRGGYGPDRSLADPRTSLTVRVLESEDLPDSGEDTLARYARVTRTAA
jgi:hypothetical protein